MITRRYSTSIAVASALAAAMASFIAERSFTSGTCNTCHRLPVALVGSNGFVEIAVREGSAAALFQLRRGQKAVLYSAKFAGFRNRVQ